MKTRDQQQIPPLRMDLQNKVVWKATERVELRPKEFAVLRHLIDHADELVTKEDLFKAVWQPENVIVGDDAITRCVYEIRKALQDDTAIPHYIKTAPKYGYRFIGPLSPGPVRVPRPVAPLPPSDSVLLRSPLPPVPPSLVGRESELALLHNLLERALDGERQTVFVTGEPGIGKTTLVRAFLAQITMSGGGIVGRGQCVEQYGPGEAYRPVLEALGRLCRDPGGGVLVQWMKQYAPSWLGQMPALLSAADLEELQGKMQGATRERMLREMSEGIEALTVEHPLVLILEDLQWSDPSTLDLIVALTHRQERARLLVLGTYRPADLILRDHPLRKVKRELQRHNQCQELALGGLTEPEVSAYLALRFPTHSLPSSLGRIIHQRTEGNPFFLVTLIDEWIARGVLSFVDGVWTLERDLGAAAAAAPESIRQIIEQQIDWLRPEERRVLEAGSVAGAEFSAAAVAAAVGVDTPQVEDWCEDMVRRRLFLRSSGIVEWPDGTVAGGYGFQHALYHKVWYERVPPARRALFHLRIGERGEQAYGSQGGERAAELAVHFEQGRDHLRAIRYLQIAAENSLQKSACQEAISFLTNGLGLLKMLPDSPVRTQQELEVQVSLGPAFMVMKGYAAPEVIQAYDRARELCQQVKETPQLFSVLRGLWRYYNVRAEHRMARGLGEQLLVLAQREQDRDLVLEGHLALGMILLQMGELSQAEAHLEQFLVLYRSQPHHGPTVLYGQDSEVTCLSALSHILWLLGYTERALQRSRDALALGRKLNHPPSLAFALSLATWLQHCCGDWQIVQTYADELRVLAAEHEFMLWSAQGNLWQGWLLGERAQGQEGVEKISQTLAAWKATGAELGLPFYLSVQAKTHGRARQEAEGLQVLAEALTRVERTEERFWEAELYRLRGELTLQQCSVQGLVCKEEERPKAKGKNRKAKIADILH